MFRVLVAILLPSSFLLLAGAAQAAPQASTTVTLACDRGASAHVDLELFDANGEYVGRVYGDCNADAKRLRQPMPGAATTVVVSSFEGSFVGTCAGEYEVPARVSCPLDGQGPGATLTVR